MRCIFKWVQLSDIHFQADKATFNAEALRNSLPEYLKDKVHGCNALILTGDYRYARDPKWDSTTVAEYIRKIATNLKVGNNIYAVPGNHDLDRSRIRSILIEGVQRGYTTTDGTIDKQVWSELLKNFGFFKEICEKLKLRSCFDDQEEYPHTVVTLDNCSLLLMNTALTAGCDTDSEKLVLGSKFINAVINKYCDDKKPIIAVGHHSLEELNPKEKDAISKIFDTNMVRLYLCGHAHEHRYRSLGEKGKEAIVGCLKQDDESVMATFAVGELLEDGTVVMTSHMWDIKEQGWFEDPPRYRYYAGLYTQNNTSLTEKPPKQLTENAFSIHGYSLLGSFGNDGIVYYWQKEGKLVESIAFNKRVKTDPNDVDLNTSAYTVSISIGCFLKYLNKQCVFCETGTRDYLAPLTGEDIALQCVFMALFDSDCDEFPLVKNHAREFAFMGQGEPGYNYAAIRYAIILNDIIMEQIGQKVSRYIISTCGITDLIPNIIEDYKRHVFKNKVSVHLSLHEVGENREKLMPISSIHDYKKVLKQCKALFNITNEKIGVGILLFKDYSLSKDSNETYTLTPDKFRKILSELDNEVFRIDLCTVNKTSAGKQHTLRENKAKELAKIAEDKGFEVKLFSSFGTDKHAGCGMLSSETYDMELTGTDGTKYFNKAVNLLRKAQDQYLGATQDQYLRDAQD